MWPFNIFRKPIQNENNMALIDNKQYIEAKIMEFKSSPNTIRMFVGESYHQGKHDILHRKRTAIGEGGKLVEVDNLPNNRLIDNQYAKMVDQKNNYLLGKPITFESENNGYVWALNDVLDNIFFKTLRNVGEATLNCGLAFIHPYYNGNGELKFKMFKGYSFVPFWKDEEHTELDYGVHLYTIEKYKSRNSVEYIEHADLYDSQGIHHFILKNNQLYEYEIPYEPYFTINGQGFNWDKVPIIPFKLNNAEQPLISRCKCLQDALNTMLSDFENTMQEDSRNTILVLKNYDGENLGQFRRNLATYGAVKVRTVDGSDGGVDTLTVQVNAENYDIILKCLRRAIIENCRGYDNKELTAGTSPNQMNIKAIFNDLDLDTNSIETEFQASMQQLLWFVNMHLINTRIGDFTKEKLNVIFDRDIMVNETEAIDNITKSVGLMPERWLIGQYPGVKDVDMIMKMKEEENSIDEDLKPIVKKVGGEDEE